MKYLLTEKQMKHIVSNIVENKVKEAKIKKPGGKFSKKENTPSDEDVFFTKIVENL